MLCFPWYLLIASLLQVRCRPLSNQSRGAVGVIVKRILSSFSLISSQIEQRKSMESEECLSIRETMHKGLTALRAWVLLLTKLYVGNSLNYICSLYHTLTRFYNRLISGMQLYRKFLWIAWLYRICRVSKPIWILNLWIQANFGPRCHASTFSSGWMHRTGNFQFPILSFLVKITMSTELEAVIHEMEQQ